MTGVAERSKARDAQARLPRIQSWTQPSTNRRTTYTLVLFQDGTRTCTCKDFVYRRQERGEPCKHLWAITPEIDEAWAAWQALETRRPLPRRTDTPRRPLGVTRVRDGQGLRRVRIWTTPDDAQTAAFEVVLYTNGTTRCACPWSNQPGGCRHRLVLVQEIARAWQDYVRRRPEAAQPPPQPTPPAPPPYHPGQPVRRAIRFDDE
jgi:hypothetical protein